MPRWTDEERAACLRGVSAHGDNWELVSRIFVSVVFRQGVSIGPARSQPPLDSPPHSQVPTRSPAQCRSHAEEALATAQSRAAAMLGASGGRRSHTRRTDRERGSNLDAAAAAMAAGDDDAINSSFPFAVYGAEGADAVAAYYDLFYPSSDRGLGAGAEATGAWRGPAAGPANHDHPGCYSNDNDGDDDEEDEEEGEDAEGPLSSSSIGGNLAPSSHIAGAMDHHAADAASASAGAAGGMCRPRRGRPPPRCPLPALDGSIGLGDDDGASAAVSGGGAADPFAAAMQRAFSGVARYRVFEGAAPGGVVRPHPPFLSESLTNDPVRTAAASFWSLAAADLEALQQAQADTRELATQVAAGQRAADALLTKLVLDSRAFSQQFGGGAGAGGGGSRGPAAPAAPVYLPYPGGVYGAAAGGGAKRSRGEVDAGAGKGLRGTALSQQQQQQRFPYLAAGATGRQWKPDPGSGFH